MSPHLTFSPVPTPQPREDSPLFRSAAPFGLGQTFWRELGDEHAGARWAGLRVDALGDWVVDNGRSPSQRVPLDVWRAHFEAPILSKDLDPEEGRQRLLDLKTTIVGTAIHAAWITTEIDRGVSWCRAWEAAGYALADRSNWLLLCERLTGEVWFASRLTVVAVLEQQWQEDKRA